MRTRSVLVAAAMLTTAVVPVVATALPAAATVNGCSANFVPGAPIGGAESHCSSGGQHRVIFACSGLSGSTTMYGPWVNAGKTSRKFCNATYPNVGRIFLQQK